MSVPTAAPGRLISPQEILREPAGRGAAVPAPAAAGRSAYIETYGCQMNVADTELVAAILGDAGYLVCERPEQADVILINTCAVREHAEERVIGRASQLSGLRAQRPNLTLGILGCMAQHLSRSLPRRAPFVDLVVGPDSYQRLPEILAQTSEETLLDVRLSRSENYAGLDPTRSSGTNAWVTIIRGCDKFCTFCIVPYVRGRERSLEAAEVLRQVRRIAAEGFRQVTLLGQTVNSYRDETGVDFATLLRSVSAVDGIDRVRFTSPYPVDFDAATIEAMATVPEICPSLHLPVQSASDRLLGLMKRGYSISQYRDLVGRLREEIPGLALTTDVIVGFCSETDAEFELTCDLMKEVRYGLGFHVQVLGAPGNGRSPRHSRRCAGGSEGRKAAGGNPAPGTDLGGDQRGRGRPHRRGAGRRAEQAKREVGDSQQLRALSPGQDGGLSRSSRAELPRRGARRPGHVPHPLRIPGRHPEPSPYGPPAGSSVQGPSTPSSLSSSLTGNNSHSANAPGLWPRPQYDRYSQ